ncbi:UDP-N-acetylglucosamine--peptide N-acetylglucosaminyltransferase subunit [Ditylenchus destructor]|uniref:UDP-N-acetylglucosamine--peptide N-acetylglucosaminyltransferase subunit n=1 Tax=Ditylenchus destructor TaxID=166010 RepID=A0AAD4MPR1_9BILA|nr:UDP-N-acetylglucosamine--peptide N-acetylglucosaminyltransferase subunit [Ditylenchus destructor]
MLFLLFLYECFDLSIEEIGTPNSIDDGLYGICLKYPITNLALYVLSKSMGHLLACPRINSSFADAHRNFGSSDKHSVCVPEAIQNYSTALELKSDSQDPICNLPIVCR